MHEDAKFDGSKFSHFINHGFVAAEREQMAELLDAKGLRGAVDGLAFRVARRESPAQALPALARLGVELDAGVLAHVRFAGESPADAYTDDHANACRVADTVLANLLEPAVSVYFDTFMDVDRGYFPRSGFIDRRYDPRPASRVYANLHAALAGRRIEALAGQDAALSSLRLARVDGEPVALVLPGDPQAAGGVTGLPAGLLRSGAGVLVTDLQTGVVSRASLGEGHVLRMTGGAPLPRGPYLIRAGDGGRG
jgi:hypothetical protein